MGWRHLVLSLQILALIDRDSFTRFQSTTVRLIEQRLV